MEFVCTFQFALESSSSGPEWNIFCVREEMWSYTVSWTENISRNCEENMADEANEDKLEHLLQDKRKWGVSVVFIWRSYTKIKSLVGFSIW